MYRAWIGCCFSTDGFTLFIVVVLFVAVCICHSHTDTRTSTHARFVCTLFKGDLINMIIPLYGYTVRLS